MHVETRFELSVSASYAETAPLFGPEGERAWAGEHWNPQFIYPLPARDQQGAVFTVKHEPCSAVWVTTIFDLEGRHFQYVSFLMNLLVTTIDVRFSPIDAAMTRVNVTYSRTAVTPEGRDHVALLSDNDKKAGRDWQEAIDKYLAGRQAKH